MLPVVGIWLAKSDPGVWELSKLLDPDKNSGIEAAVNSPLAIKESRMTVLAYWLAFAAF